MPRVVAERCECNCKLKRLYTRAEGGKERLTVDEYGLRVVTAEPDATGEHRTVLTLGQRFRCRIRGLDIWSGSLDLAPL